MLPAPPPFPFHTSTHTPDSLVFVDVRGRKKFGEEELMEGGRHHHALRVASRFKRHRHIHIWTKELIPRIRNSYICMCISFNRMSGSLDRI